MKKIFKKSLIPLSMLAACFTLFSFTSRWGGEGFEIFLNNRLISQQFGKDMNTVKSLQLDQRYSNAELTIKYYHCGKAGKNREISIRDDQNNLLKKWSFDNASVSDNGMSCPVNEILSLEKRNNSKAMNLYYSSDELPNGRLLMTIVR